MRRKSVFLELTPPANTARAPRATQELFSVIHGFRASRTLRQKLLRREVVFSFEMPSTREQGVRYVVQVDERLADSLQQAITSYLPQIKVAEVKGVLPNTMEIIEFKQTGHYAFPLTSIDRLDQHDPVAYLAGAMTKLAPREQVRVQLVVTPVRLNEAKTLARRILGNEDLLSHLNARKLPFVAGIGRLISSSLFMATDAVGEVYHGSTRGSYGSSYGSARENYERMQVSTRKRPARTLSAFELELMETMHEKLNQPLFRVSFRAGVCVDNPDTGRERLSAIRTSLHAYSVPSYQMLHSRVNNPVTRNLRRYAFAHHLPALLHRHSLVLSSSELGSLYHFPLGNTAQTDNLITSLSRTLPAPVSLKQNKTLDVVLGQNEHHGTSTPIGLTAAERERHEYIIGGTGNGKTTLLQYQIVQDMQNGKGLAVVDPHGDMAEALLRHVPKERIKDVVYFNPDDLEYPIGVNLLELTPGLTGNELLREKDIITEQVVSVFRKIFSDEDTGGHRIEYVLRNTVQTALTLPDATLFTVFDLLNDPKFRKSVIRTLKDKNLINFWKNELGKAGDMQKVKMAAGITAKIGRFLFSASARQILEQPTSTIDFDDIINSGKILICNFSKGLLGEDTSELFGITVLAKLQLASLRRARIAQQERRAFFLYVDEFQNFATQSFVQMLSESRKYKLFMIMAEQSTSQQDDQQMVSIILANVGTVICFRTGNPQDERVLLPLFSPYIEQGEISNLPAFNFYAKLSAVQAQEPLSGQTLLLPDEGSDAVAASVVERSRAAFARQQATDDESTAEQPPPAKTNTKTTKARTKKSAADKSDEMLDMA
ncbi:MAG TPA: DUF87 domain-containing protein [Candidatus Saccharimonadales bacterium]|nr:DUF87 domain-containing protein [Candidatus Saccharimonadales bacterium]